jgi:hypothetical protein
MKIQPLKPIIQPSKMAPLAQVQMAEKTSAWVAGELGAVLKRRFSGVAPSTEVYGQTIRFV